MVADVDLNLCRQVRLALGYRVPIQLKRLSGYLAAICHGRLTGMQVRDQWGFQLTARYEMYAKQLKDYVHPHYEPEIIKDASLA